MKRRSLYAFIFLFSAGQAAAYTDTGGRYTFGPDGYAGVNAFFEWGDDDYYLRPSLNSYKSDISDRVSSYAFGAGLDRKSWSAGAELSFTPETGGYSNAAISADFTYNLIPEPEEGVSLQDAGIGLFAGLIAHEDAYSVSTAAVSGGAGRRGRSASSSELTEAFKLTQADYGISASLKAYGLRAYARFTKTSYNKDVTAEVRQLPIDIGGIGASGFPDTALSARLSIPGMPISPSAGYTKTCYLLDQPDSESFSLGLSLVVGKVDISAGWESFNAGAGLATSEYYSAGFSVSF